jgi:hypothetical protein
MNNIQSVKPNLISLSNEPTYHFYTNPLSNLDYAKNLSSEYWASSKVNDRFNAYLSKLITAGILTPVYDIKADNYREALYNFSDGTQISFDGLDHMSLNIEYCY